MVGTGKQRPLDEWMDTLQRALLANCQHLERTHGQSIFQDYRHIADEHFSAGNFDVREIAGEMVFQWKQDKKINLVV